jgi:prepilin-type N-terminal cleavage/methylation domain-containing protein
MDECSPHMASRTWFGQAGVSLVELLIAISILAALSLAFVPILVQGINVSASNATTSSAVQIAQRESDYARSFGASCSAIANLDSSITPVPSEQDGRSVRLDIERTVGSCPTAQSAYPATISFAIEVSRRDTGKALASVETLVIVDGP